MQGYYAKALEAGRIDGSGGLSARTVLHHHRVLHAALHQAVRWQLVGRNVAEAVEPPRPARKEMQALDEAATATLLHGAEGTRLHAPILVAVTTGLRRGELLALRWDDVDLSSGTIVVRRSLQETRDGLTFKPPKTAKGQRRVTLPAMTSDALRRHRGAQSKQRLALGDAWSSDPRDLVFPLADGRAWPPDSFSSAFKELAARCGMPTLRLHDLRHTHATQLLRQGVNVKVVSERIGHSTTAFTMDTYAHVLPGMQEEAAARVDEALRKALGDAPGSSA